MRSTLILFGILSVLFLSGCAHKPHPQLYKYITDADGNQVLVTANGN